MSLPVIANASASLTASGVANARSIAAASLRNDVPGKAGASGSTNASAAPASSQVSIASGSNPASLLLKAAVTGINDSLKPAYGENALPGTNSQKATAAVDQIMSLITQFLEALKQKQASEDGATNFKDLVATIRDGFEQGYEEAMNLLKGMGVLSDDMASELTKIHDLVLKGLSDLESAQSSGIGSNAAAATEANS